MRKFGNVEAQKSTFFEEFKGFEEIKEERVLSETKRAHKIKVSMDLKRVSLLEEISWRQKSRAMWLKEVDKFTKFFHRFANLHSLYNAIEALMVDRSVSPNPTEITNHIVNYYKNLLLEKFSWRPRLDGLQLDALDSQGGQLERYFEET